jgi:hypothetical protein
MDMFHKKLYTIIKFIISLNFAIINREFTIFDRINKTGSVGNEHCLYVYNVCYEKFPVNFVMLPFRQTLQMNQ